MGSVAYRRRALEKKLTSKGGGGGVRYYSRPVLYNVYYIYIKASFKVINLRKKLTRKINSQSNFNVEIEMGFRNLKADNISNLYKHYDINFE